MESIFQNGDMDGNDFILFKAIMDHKSIEKAFKKSEGYITCNNLAPDLKKSVKG